MTDIHLDSLKQCLQKNPLPWTARGNWVADANGNEVCECSYSMPKDADRKALAQIIATAVNTYFASADQESPPPGTLSAVEAMKQVRRFSNNFRYSDRNDTVWDTDQWRELRKIVESVLGEEVYPDDSSKSAAQ